MMLRRILCKIFGHYEDIIAINCDCINRYNVIKCTFCNFKRNELCYRNHCEICDSHIVWDYCYSDVCKTKRILSFWIIYLEFFQNNKIIAVFPDSFKLSIYNGFSKDFKFCISNYGLDVISKAISLPEFEKVKEYINKLIITI